MAIYYVSTTGSNSNAGTSAAAPVATIAYAVTLATSVNDVIALKANQTHALLANLLLTTYNVVFDTYDWDGSLNTRAKISGAYEIQMNAVRSHAFYNIDFQHGNSGRKFLVGVSVSSALNKTIFANCNFTVSPSHSTQVVFDQNASTEAALAFIDCTATAGTKGTTTFIGTSQTANSSRIMKADLERVTLTNFQSLIADVGATPQLSFTSCIINNCSYLFNFKIAANTIGMLQAYFINNTIFGMTSFLYRNVSSSSLGIQSFTGISLKRNFINCTQMIDQANTSETWSMDGLNNNQNAFYSTGRTNVTTVNDTTITNLSDAQFYDAANGDFRILLDSPLSLKPSNDCIGAWMPEHDSFYSGVPTDKVQAGYSYRERSLINNKIGTLATAAGETDPNKVLNTSTVVTGLYIPVVASNVKKSVVFGLSQTGTLESTDPGIANVLSGVSYKIESVTKTGTYEAPVSTDPGTANVRLGTSYQISGVSKTGTLNLPSVSDVKEGVTFDNALQTGTLHIYATDSILASELKIGVTKIIKDVSVTGTYEALERNDEILPSKVESGLVYLNRGASKTGTNKGELFNTDIDPANLKHGVTVSSLGVSKTGSYRGYDLWEALVASQIKSGVSKLQDGIAITGTVIEENTDNVLASELKDGVSKIIKGATVLGTYRALELNTFPAQDKILEGSSYKENGTNKVGTLHIPVSTDPGEENVRENISYKINDVNKNGTLHIKYSDDLSANELKIGVSKVINDVEVIGTHDGSERFILPLESQVEEGVEYLDNDIEKVGTLEKLDLNRFTDVPTNRVTKNYPYKYNSDVNNRLGTAEGTEESTDPGEDNVLKDVEYVINGENKKGKFDTGDDGVYTEYVTRFKILEKVQDQLYKIDSVNNTKFNNKVKLVEIGVGTTKGLSNDDYPYIQVTSDNSVYNHRKYLNANIPLVTLRVTLLVQTPSGWNDRDNESLYEDVRKSLIYGNFTLDGMVQFIKFETINPKPSQNTAGNIKSAEITFSVQYVELIEQN